MALRARIMDKCAALLARETSADAFRRDTELAGLSAQLHRAQLVLEEAQEEAAGRAAELQGCLDAVAAQLRTKEDEAEEADDRLIEYDRSCRRKHILTNRGRALKEKKRQEGRADALARKVLALEEKVKQIAQVCLEVFACGSLLTVFLSRSSKPRRTYFPHLVRARRLLCRRHSCRCGPRRSNHRRDRCRRPPLWNPRALFSCAHRPEAHRRCAPPLRPPSLLLFLSFLARRPVGSRR